MPGTWGTLGIAITAAALLFWVPAVAENWQWVCGVWVVGATALTVLLTPEVELSDGKDPQIIVMDEVAGYWATLIFIAEPTLAHLVAAFFLFRLLDVLKPWPASAFERLPGGWGVVLDDVMAGLYGAAILYAVDVWA